MIPLPPRMSIASLTARRPASVKCTLRIALATLGLEAETVLWNVVPAHPHRPGEPLSNRTPTVGVVTIRYQQALLTAELAGRTSPYREADVRPQINGIVKAQLFEQGTDLVRFLLPGSSCHDHEARSVGVPSQCLGYGARIIPGTRYADDVGRQGLQGLYGPDRHTNVYDRSAGKELRPVPDDEPERFFEHGNDNIGRRLGILAMQV